LPARSDCNVLVDHFDRLLATPADAIEREQCVGVGRHHPSAGIGETCRLD
jgi:hypothetical protein